jgi:AraC-like DNA-binding protein
MTRACLYRLLLLIRSAVMERHLPDQTTERAAAKERHRQLIQNAKEFIQANMNKSITLSDIAGHLGISACHLSHLFSEESGFTLSSFLTNSRMETAAQLLTNPKMRVSEAAYAVGFEDPNYFCKVFRRHYGCSPGRYRIRKPRGTKTAKKSPQSQISPLPKTNACPNISDRI